VAEVPIDVNLSTGQVLDIRQAPAVCLTAEPTEGCKLERRLTDAITTVGVLPNVLQQTRSPLAKGRCELASSAVLEQATLVVTHA
jgi:hypothetical protein